MLRTINEGLVAAFTAESVNVQRYTYFAQVAEIEGHAEAATLFRQLAAHASCVAHGHLDQLGMSEEETEEPVGDTAANLLASLRRERFDIHGALAGAAEEARDAGLPDLASWYRTLVALKSHHLRRLETALSNATGSVTTTSGSRHG